MSASGSESVGEKKKELEHHKSESFRPRVRVRIGARRGQLYIYEK